MTGNVVLTGASAYTGQIQQSRTQVEKSNKGMAVNFESTMYAVSSEPSRKQKVRVSAVDDYIKRHPDSSYQIQRMVNAGEKVLADRRQQDVDAMTMEETSRTKRASFARIERLPSEMTMEEYKEYIYDVLDSIPFDVSQQRDTQFVDITEEGWEQMKNDPKYEAWVVGYFKIDRSVKNPFANYPGVEPRIHTEHFGASIDEHLGQSYPQSMSSGSEKDSEDWWKKRKERHEQYLEEAQMRTELRRNHRRGTGYENNRCYDKQDGTEIGVTDILKWQWKQ